MISRFISVVVLLLILSSMCVAQNGVLSESDTPSEYDERSVLEEIKVLDNSEAEFDFLKKANEQSSEESLKEALELLEKSENMVEESDPLFELDDEEFKKSEHTDYEGDDNLSHDLKEDIEMQLDDEFIDEIFEQIEDDLDDLDEEI